MRNEAYFFLMSVILFLGLTYDSISGQLCCGNPHKIGNSSQDPPQICVTNIDPPKVGKNLVDDGRMGGNLFPPVLGDPEERCLK